MRFKAILNNEEELASVQEPLRGIYKKGDDGKYYWPLEKEDLLGHPATAPLANAHKETKEKLAAAQEYAKNFEGLTPEQAKQAKEYIKKLEEDAEAKLMGSGDIDKILASKLGPIQSERDDLHAKYTAAQKKLDSIDIKEFIREKTKECQILDTAFDDLHNRLKGLLQVTDGQVTACDENVQDTTEYLIKQVNDLEKSAPHLFKRSDGPNLLNPNKGNPNPSTDGLTPAQRINQARGVSQTK